jgi:hypothetical protein
MELIYGQVDLVHAISSWVHTIHWIVVIQTRIYDSNLMLRRGMRWSIFDRTRDDLRLRLNHAEAAALGTEHSSAPRSCHTSLPDPRLSYARATKPQVFSIIRHQDSVGNSPRGTTGGGVTERRHAMAAPLFQASSMMPRFSKAHPMMRSSQRNRCPSLKLTIESY